VKGVKIAFSYFICLGVAERSEGSGSVSDGDRTLIKTDTVPLKTGKNFRSDSLFTNPQRSLNLSKLNHYS
jgi:hypothetical protein